MNKIIVKIKAAYQNNLKLSLQTLKTRIGLVRRYIFLIFLRPKNNKLQSGAGF